MTLDTLHRFEELTPEPHHTTSSWREAGLCAQTDPEVFFPEKGGKTTSARAVCQSCDLRQQCLEYALAHDEWLGLWGGLSERERRRLKRGIREGTQ